MLPEWIQAETKTISQQSIKQAENRQQQLTKPAGSLGRLEQLAVQFAGMQSSEFPHADQPHIIVFAGDHGIAEEGVSAFPQVVTTEMIKNFSRGGAAISVLAKQLGAHLRVVDVGSANPAGALAGVIDARIAAGTENFLKTAAMSESQCEQALTIGRQQLSDIAKQGCDLFIAGEMGIANTTAATALASYWLDKPAAALVGPGTGLNKTGVQHKTKVIDNALSVHRASMTSDFSVLQTLGGFEIAAMCGAYIAAAQAGIAILVDGFISTTAFYAAVKLNPGVQHWGVFAHQSAEPGHRFLLQALEAQPILEFDMHLGEASGAAVVVNLLRTAFNLHNNMATFEEAGVSTADVDL